MARKRLTEEQELRIVNLRDDGLTRPIIAKRFGISLQTVGSVLKKHGRSGIKNDTRKP